MVLKLFLLALGANGVLAVEYHQGASRIFWIVNFFVLYIYAIPYFIYKLKKILKASASTIIIDKNNISLRKENESLVEIPVKSIDKLIIEEAVSGLLIEGGGSRLYIGGPNAKGSMFYINSADEIIQNLKKDHGSKPGTFPKMRSWQAGAVFIPPTSGMNNT